MVTTPAALPTNNPNLRRCDVQSGERIFKVVPEFTYPGLKVSMDDNRMNDNSMEAELRAMMLATNRSYYSLRNRFTSKKTCGDGRTWDYIAPTHSTGIHIRL